MDYLAKKCYFSLVLHNSKEGDLCVKFKKNSHGLRHFGDRVDSIGLLPRRGQASEIRRLPVYPASPTSIDSIFATYIYFLLSFIETCNHKLFCSHTTSGTSSRFTS